MYINGKFYLMLNIKYGDFSFLGVVSLLFMVHSGLIKWIPFFSIDPFIFFIILLFLYIIFNKGNHIFNKYSFQIGFVIICFFAWSFFTINWGSSKLYFNEKIQKSFVLLFCFFTPFFIFLSKKSLQIFIDIYLSIAFISSCTLLLLFFFYGDIFLILNSNPNIIKATRFPNYLSLGIFLSIAIILALHKKGVKWEIFSIINFLSIILLAPRGPLLILIGIYLFFIFKNFKFSFFPPRRYFLYIFLIFPFFETLFLRLANRINDIGNVNSSAFSSIKERQYLFNKGINYLLDNPVFGIGYGSFGFKLNGLESRIQVHSLLLEITIETGFIGFFIFLFFLFLIYHYSTNCSLSDNEEFYSIKLVVVYLIICSFYTMYLVDSKDLFFWLSFLIVYTNFNLKKNYINK
jgi:O-antigen ligase